MKIYQAPLPSLGCFDALNTIEGEKVKLRRGGINSGGILPEKLRGGN